MHLTSHELPEYQRTITSIFYYLFLGLGALLVIPSFYLPLGLRLFPGNTSGNIPIGTDSSYTLYIAKGSGIQQFILILDALVVVTAIALMLLALINWRLVKGLGKSLLLALVALVISIINGIYVFIFSNEIFTRRSSIMPQEAWDKSVLNLSAVFAFYVIGALIMFIISIMLLLHTRYSVSPTEAPVKP